MDQALTPKEELGTTGSQPDHPYAQFVNPYLDGELAKLKLNKRFVRAAGCNLYDEHGREYLDFVAMYGALPFGYNPPAIWEAVRAFAASEEPSFAQPSRLDAAGELAQRLIELAPAGLAHVTFANSGAEAVEAAIKLARAATRRLGILSTVGGFHGKTLAAVSATGRRHYQEPFGAPIDGFEHVPYGDVRALDNVLSKRADEFAAFIVEPIQGEGGIVVPPADYLARVKKVCARHGVLLILDEIQTGLGRTGKLFACETSGICPDIMVLAKALGGGLIPIGAVLCTETVYTEEFALKHSSTFAGNGLACRIGLKSLELLTQIGFLDQVTENSLHLLGRLQQLRERYPELVTDVRGTGYMIGIELTHGPESFAHRCLLSAFAAEEELAIVVCSHLLNHHHIRTLTTLNGGRVIRVEPPLIATKVQCDKFVDAMEETLEDLRACNSARVLRHVAERPDPVPKLSRAMLVQRPVQCPQREPEGRWAFIIHPLEVRSIIEFDPSLGVLREDELDRVLRFIQDSRQPSIVGSTLVESGRCRAYGEFIDVNFTAKDFKRLPFERVLADVRKAVELARDRGAQIVGLGGFTSIVSRNGLDLQDLGVPVTTGNSYTAVATVEALLNAPAATTVPEKATAVVIGAVGAVGRAVASLLVSRVRVLYLLGNPDYPERSLAELDKLKMELHAMPGRTAEVRTSVDLPRCLLEAQFVVSTSSSTEFLIQPHHLAANAIVCDTALPPDVHPDVARRRPDVTVIAGGVVRLPGGQDAGVRLGLEQGRVFGCMAETMMLALSQKFDQGTVGPALSMDRLSLMAGLAKQFDFKPATA